MSDVDADAIVIAGTATINVAPAGTTMPTSLSDPLDAAFVPAGYSTDDGVKFTDSKTVQGVRPHQSFGTIELRNADGAPDVAEAIALAAFGYLMTARALRAIDDGEPAQLPAGRLLEENQWRAIRHGMSVLSSTAAPTPIPAPSVFVIRSLTSATRVAASRVAWVPSIRQL